MTSATASTRIQDLNESLLVQHPDPVKVGVLFCTNPKDEYKLIPNNFTFSEYPDLDSREDRAAWLIGFVIDLHNFYNLPPSAFVNISHQTMQQMITRHASSCYGRPGIPQLLLDLGVLECDGHYSPKKHFSQGWRLSPAFWTGYKQWKLSDPHLIAKIQRNRIRYKGKPVSEAELQPEHAGLLGWQRKVEIRAGRDRDSAWRAVQARMASRGQTDPTPYIYSLETIINQKWGMIVDQKQGRLYTAITNACKEIRNHLTINGQYLYTLDLKNSQLVFLCIRIERGGRGGGVNPKALHNCYLFSQKAEQEARIDPKALHNCYQFEAGFDTEIEAGEISDDSICLENADYQEFRRRVMDGSFYEHLRSEFNGLHPDEQFADKTVFKPAFFQSVLYGDHQEAYAQPEYNQLTCLFSQLYPTVWAYLVRTKQGKDWKQLSIDMQRDESDLFIRQVCGRILREHPEIPLITIHDATMTTKENLALVHRVVIETFQKFGCEPTLAEEAPKIGEDHEHDRIDQSSTEGTRCIPEAPGNHRSVLQQDEVHSVQGKAVRHVPDDSERSGSSDDESATRDRLPIPICPLQALHEAPGCADTSRAEAHGELGRSVQVSGWTAVGEAGESGPHVVSVAGPHGVTWEGDLEQALADFEAHRVRLLKAAEVEALLTDWQPEDAAWEPELEDLAFEYA